MRKKTHELYKEKKPSKPQNTLPFSVLKKKPQETQIYYNCCYLVRRLCLIEYHIYCKLM